MAFVIVIEFRTKGKEVGHDGSVGCQTLLYTTGNLNIARLPYSLKVWEVLDFQEHKFKYWTLMSVQVL